MENLEPIIPKQIYSVINPSNKKKESWSGERIIAHNINYPSSKLRIVPDKEESKKTSKKTKNIE